MFGMGWQEILLIVAIAVLVIGPEQLPQVARTIGKMMAQFKRATNDLRTAVNDEINQYQEYKEFREFTENLETEVRSAGGTTRDYIEHEIREGERELEHLGKEVQDATGDPGTLTNPATYQPTIADFPSEDELHASPPHPAGAAQAPEDEAAADAGADPWRTAQAPPHSVHRGNGEDDEQPTATGPAEPPEPSAAGEPDREVAEEPAASAGEEPSDPGRKETA